MLVTRFWSHKREPSRSVSGPYWPVTWRQLGTEGRWRAAGPCPNRRRMLPVIRWTMADSQMHLTGYAGKLYRSGANVRSEEEEVT